MKVTLSKNIPLQSAEVFLKIQKEELRSDIQDFLQGKKNYEGLIADRMKDYLKHIGIFDEQYQLTKLGNAVKDTGKMWTMEQGKYQIWFADDDSFFGSKIMYFRRLQPNFSKENDAKRMSLDKKEHFLLPTEHNSYTSFELVEENFYGNTIDAPTTLSFFWIWDKFEKSHYHFEGKFGKKDKWTAIKNEAISSEKDIQKTISEILPEWNNKQKRYGIRFDHLNEESRKTFEDKNFGSKWNGFEVVIQNLPLMPYDKDEAEKWRNWFVIEELKKDYYSPSDLQQKIFQLNEKQEFTLFELDIPEAESFIQELDSKNPESKLIFWHLQAPMDLNPNTKIKLSAKPIEIQKDKKFSFENIVQLLNIKNSETIIYYDRYVIREKQQKAAAALTKAVNASKNIIITDLTTKEYSSNFIQEHEPNIKLRDMKTIFTTTKPSHDRYLIAINQGKMEIWNISNSLDYIFFSDQVITKDSEGTIRQSVVFTPISKEMLDTNLLQFITKEIQNGN